MSLNKINNLDFFKQPTTDVIFCLLCQVYPKNTIFTLTACSLTIHTITLTPTIPVRQNNDSKWPMISFWLPPEIQLLDEQCEIALKGKTSVTLKIKATCPTTEVTEGLKAITPHISVIHSKTWHPKVYFPTIKVHSKFNL